MHGRRGRAIRFRFRGKCGQRHEVGLRDRRLATRHPALPGPARPGPVPVRRRRRRAHDVTSDDVNDYLREISGTDFTAKDFRTWAGTVLAYRALRALAPVEDDRRRQAQRRRGRAADRGPARQHPAVARNSYVHPAILDAYLDGAIGGALLEAAEEQANPPSAADPEEEAEVVDLLRKRIATTDSGTGRTTRRPYAT